MPLKGTSSVTIELMVGMGSKWERKSNYGMSHMVEHMAFKGTKKRPSGTAINNEIDSKGAHYGAETGLETVSFQITTVKENIKWASELLSDIVFNSTYPKGELSREKKVVIEEVKMYSDNPMMGVGNEYLDFLYGGSKKGCWMICGRINDVKYITRSGLWKFRKKYFGIDNMVLVVAGDLSGISFDVFSDFNKYTDQITSFSNNVVVELNKVKIKRLRRETDQAHLIMGVPTVGSSSKEIPALKILDAIMSGNSSSRLFNRLREEMGMAYYVSSAGENMREAGFWAVQIGVPVNKVKKAMSVIEREVEGLADSLTLADVRRAKNYLKGTMKIMMDRSHYWTDTIGERWLLEGKLVTPIDEWKEIEKVSLKELAVVARKYFMKREIRSLVISRDS